MKINKSNKGFSSIEAVLLIVIVLAIAGVGYYVYRANQNSLNPNNTVDVAKAASYQSPPTTTATPVNVSNGSTLNTAYQQLNQTAIGANSADSNYLTTQTNGF